MTNQCLFDDAFCPCQDGDPCHYLLKEEAMRTPTEDEIRAYSEAFDPEHGEALATLALTDEACATLACSAAGIPDLKLIAAQLHHCRQDYQLVSAEYMEEIKAFNERTKALVERKSNMACALEIAEDTLREAALAAFALTNDKHPGPGVTIRAHHELRYDEDDARDWCLHNLPVALETTVVFKRKLFEAVVEPAGLKDVWWLSDHPLVQEEPTYTVAIDRDLDKALLGEKPS